MCIPTGDYKILSALDDKAVNTEPEQAPADVVIVADATPVGLVIHRCLIYDHVCQQWECQARGSKFDPVHQRW
ncbi:hypothetical protein SCLCIDRAFT_1216432 [Scleroderma citrinum Foug A]|uniref:Uncharacterized protein n=1 Tax=Scleroderma citrinum Foug A TaxID=1036808 RepID=A0A0C2ZGZ4_9AGAM|nr:hypothetical protein SCLCIDRAFT_1216432 [Scleroderma citrinum Foug A]